MNTSPLAGIDLHDILAAPPPAFWPPAPGWWVLAVLVLSLLVVSIWQGLRIVRQRRRRARILSELDNLTTHSPDQVVTQVSMLLRRVALMHFTRHEVAPLSGKAWLAFLDRTGGDGAFTQGAGNVLATVPYVSARKVSGVDNDALIALARAWIRKNLGRRA